MVGAACWELTPFFWKVLVGVLNLLYAVNVQTLEKEAEGGRRRPRSCLPAALPASQRREAGMRPNWEGGCPRANCRPSLSTVCSHEVPAAGAGRPSASLGTCSLRDRVSGRSGAVWSFPKPLFAPYSLDDVLLKSPPLAACPQGPGPTPVCPSQRAASFALSSSHVNKCWLFSVGLADVTAGRAGGFPALRGPWLCTWPWPAGTLWQASSS